MNEKITIPELVAPAGNFEKLKVAFSYGADAAYLGGRRFGLRAAADNFTDEEIIEAIDYAHKRDKKIYVTLNAMPHNRDIEKIKNYLSFLDKAGPDALIISDPGVLSLAKDVAPSLSCTLSTQANNVNYKSALFWRDAGVERIVAARDISIEEVRETVSKIPNDLEIEIFVHGAMCISYSGRCLLSSYMTGREANTGECTQPCRWKYRLLEEKRPGEYFPVIEENQMTTIMSSKDLCLIEHIPEIVKSGVAALKIEGRMKSSYYAAVVVSAYRAALDSYSQKGDDYKFNPRWLEELKKVNHRDYTDGFYTAIPDSSAQNYSPVNYIKEYEFLGLVKSYDKDTGLAEVEQKNKIVRGDKVEFINPRQEYFTQEVGRMYNEDMEPVEDAPHSGQIIWIKTLKKVEENYIIRKKIIKEKGK